MTESDWNRTLDMYNTLERLGLTSLDLEDVVPIRTLLEWVMAEKL